MDRLAIQLLFANIASAWNEGSGERYASYFTDLSDYVTYNGSHLKGRDEIARYHDALFKGLLKGSTFHGEIRNIRFPADHIAIVHQTGAIRLAFQKKLPGRRLSVNTNVLIKMNGAWKVSAFHNCRIRKEPLVARLLDRLLTGIA